MILRAYRSLQSLSIASHRLFKQCSLLIYGATTFFGRVRSKFLYFLGRGDPTMISATDETNGLEASLKRAIDSVFHGD